MKPVDVGRWVSLAAEEPPSLPTRVRFSAVFESPIVVLPRTAKNAQVLVAHLGQIHVTNDAASTSDGDGGASDDDSRGESTRNASMSTLDSKFWFGFFCSWGSKDGAGTHQERFDIEVRDMALYSLNVDDKWRTSFSHFHAGAGPSAFLRVTAQVGVAILFVLFHFLSRYL